MAEIYYGDKRMNQIVSHLEEVTDAVWDEAKEGERRGKAILARERSSTRWRKIYGPDHLTEVEAERGEVDSFISLIAPNPMAIEYGHDPSGVFGPGGSLEHVESKAPDGLYIINDAAGLLGRTVHG